MSKRKRESKESKGTNKRKPKRIEFEDMTFFKKGEFYELQNWLAANQDYADIIMSIVAKEHHVAQRIIEYAQTGYAKKYNLCLDNGRFDVRERFKYGPRKDPNCRGEWLPVPYKDEIYRTTTRQLHGLIFAVAGGLHPDTLDFVKREPSSKSAPSIPLGPLFQYILDNYEVIKNDLNHNRDLIPQKKKVSNIPRPRCQAPRTAAYWKKKPPFPKEKHEDANGNQT